MTLAAPTVPPVTFTPQQYFYLSEHNMLGEGRTELINGEIVPMCSQFDLHAFCVSRLASWLHRAYPERKFWVRVQMSLWCNNSVPEPDLAVIDGPASATRTVMTADRALLVAEVADSTLAVDLRTKPAIYAAAGVREYWVVDANALRLVVHRGPEKSRGRWRYAEVGVLDQDATVTPMSCKRRLPVGSVLPPIRG